MKAVELGTTGVEVSELCLGTMMFGRRTNEAEAQRIADYALDHGVTFWDTAAMYSDGRCEEIIGHLLKGRRDKVFLGTKVHKGVDYTSITGSLDESLHRLGTDRADLFMVHWPVVGMKPAEIMRALNDVVRAGKTRFVGCCNFPAWLLAHCNAIASANGWPKLVCNQIPYNPVERGVEVEVLPQAFSEKIAITVYRPILQGILAGKYVPGAPVPQDSRGQTDDRVTRWMTTYDAGVRFFLDFAGQRGVSPSAVAFAWLRGSPAVTSIIAGPSRLAQFEDSVRSMDFTLTSEERDAISNAFGAEVKEDSGGKFPELRRVINLLG